MITVVLDDDPTGTQAMADVAVVLDWLAPDAWDVVQPADRAVHVLTNARAHNGAAAAELVASAAMSARTRFPDSRVILRGDSTLRAHLWEEYEALAQVIAPRRDGVPLLLVPALPAAGRVTIGGVQLIEREGDLIPLDQTEYARDGVFAYASAELSRWAQERSAGRFAADDAIMVALDRLRALGGAAEVAEAIASAAGRGRPAVVVPDAVNESDLITIAEGLHLAESVATPVVVRCAPAFVAALTGVGTAALAPPPSGDHGVLVLCGSFVPTSTAQIESLARAHPGVTVPAHVAALAGDGWDREVQRVSERARSLIEANGLAIVVTERNRDLALADVASQRRIAVALAQVARSVRAGVVIAKGGITSAVTAREGLDVRAARVVGPIRPGVSCWRLADGSDYLVVPGNVGGADLLVELVNAIAPRPVAAEAHRC